MGKGILLWRLRQRLNYVTITVTIYRRRRSQMEFAGRGGRGGWSGLRRLGDPTCCSMWRTILQAPGRCGRPYRISILSHGQ